MIHGGIVSFLHDFNHGNLFALTRCDGLPWSRSLLVLIKRHQGKEG